MSKNMLAIIPKLTDEQKELFIKFGYLMPVGPGAKKLVRKKMTSIVDLAFYRRDEILNSLKLCRWGIMRNDVLGREIIRLLEREGVD